MTVTVKSKSSLTIPEKVQRQAGIKAGDRVQFKVSARTITITATPQKTYKPSKAEWAAIRRGEAALARGESVSLSEFLKNELDSPRRKASAKDRRKVSR